MSKRVSLISSILSVALVLISLTVGISPAFADNYTRKNVDGIGNEQIGHFTCEKVENNVCVNPSRFEIKKGTLTWINYNIEDSSGKITKGSASGNSVGINSASFKNGDYKFYVLYGGSNNTIYTVSYTHLTLPTTERV